MWSVNEMILKQIIKGKRVKISKNYGGGTGVIVDIASGYSDEYIIVKKNKLNKIFHISDLSY